ncbi:hypothetical protein AVEN_132709-1 [Araneus ventricosus]|uniref:Uncharacterized protein n=1 Tax=Araneus ventricosus TaxID=182803 RepID=A0A4Y2AXC9_ARAVE|nr:hypothetical protein AVEN_132709-1 [Araneus ventricosus]
MAEISYHYPLADYPVPYRQEGIGYRLYQIQKYQVKVSGTSAYQYQLVPDTGKPGINPTLQISNSLASKGKKTIYSINCYVLNRTKCCCHPILFALRVSDPRCKPRPSSSRQGLEEISSWCDL